MVCEKCGGVLADDCRFCTHCGAPVPFAREWHEWDDQAVDDLIQQMEQQAAKQPSDREEAKEAEAVPSQDEQKDAACQSEASIGFEPQEKAEEAKQPQQNESAEAKQPSTEDRADQRPIYARDCAQKEPPHTTEKQLDKGEETVPCYRPVRTQDASEMSTGEWVMVLLLTIIPVVNLVVLCVWAFTSHTDSVKRSYARAALIVLAIVTVLGVAFLAALVLDLISAALLLL